MKTNDLGKDMFIDIFWRWSMYIDHNAMNENKYRELIYSIQFEHQTLKQLKYGR
jgi:hypothetical protein